MLEGLQSRGFKCINFIDDESSDSIIESRIANSIITLVVLTENCLQMREVLLALQAASFHYESHSRIILVHAAESCPFPVPPSSVQSCFEEKAITWLQCKSKVLLCLT